MIAAAHSTDLDMTRRLDGATHFFTLRGSAALPCVERLQVELNRLVAMRPGHVVLNVSGVDSIAALARGTIAFFIRAVQRQGGRVQIVDDRQHERALAL